FHAAESALRRAQRGVCQRKYHYPAGADVGGTKDCDNGICPPEGRRENSHPPGCSPARPPALADKCRMHHAKSIAVGFPQGGRLRSRPTHFNRTFPILTKRQDFCLRGQTRDGFNETQLRKTHTKSRHSTEVSLTATNSAVRAFVPAVTPSACCESYSTRRS